MRPTLSKSLKVTQNNCFRNSSGFCFSVRSMALFGLIWIMIVHLSMIVDGNCPEVASAKFNIFNLDRTNYIELLTGISDSSDPNSWICNYMVPTIYESSDKQSLYMNLSYNHYNATSLDNFTFVANEYDNFTAPKFKVIYASNAGDQGFIGWNVTLFHYQNDIVGMYCCGPNENDTKEIDYQFQVFYPDGSKYLNVQSINLIWSDIIQHNLNPYNYELAFMPQPSNLCNSTYAQLI